VYDHRLDNAFVFVRNVALFSDSVMKKTPRRELQSLKKLLRFIFFGNTLLAIRPSDFAKVPGLMF
jgi:hypothetical protein